MAYNKNPSYLPLNGGTMTGNLVLAGDPTSNLEAATKQYVDSHSGGSAVAFRAHLNSNTATTFTGDGTFVTVPFDTVDYDTNSGYNTGTNQYTVQPGEGGIYQINYTVFTYRTTGSNNVQLLDILVNGATVIRNYEVNFENMQTSGELTLTSGLQYQLNAGDTIEVQCSVGGGAKNIGFAGAYCVFSAIRTG